MPVENSDKFGLPSIASILAFPERKAGQINYADPEINKYEQARQRLIAWTKLQEEAAAAEAKEMSSAADYAKSHKWRWQQLREQGRKAWVRADSYRDARVSLERREPVLVIWPYEDFYIYANKGR